MANRRTNRKTRPGSVSGVARMSITLCAGETPTPPSKAPPSARWIPTDWARDQVTIATTRKHRLIIGGCRGRLARVGSKSKDQPEDPSGFGQWRGASVYHAMRGRDARATFKGRSGLKKDHGIAATRHAGMIMREWRGRLARAGGDPGSRTEDQALIDQRPWRCCLSRYTRARRPRRLQRLLHRRAGLEAIGQAERRSRRHPWPRVDHWRVAWASRPRGWRIEAPTGRPVRIRSVAWRECLSRYARARRPRHLQTVRRLCPVSS